MAFLYLENNYAGISGDLLVSALADLVGVDKMDKFLKNVLDQLPRGDSQLLRFTRKTERTLSGLHLTFDIIHHSDHLHPPKKYSDHHHDSPSAPHYSLLAMKADLTTALSLENFNEKAKTTALLMLDILIDAEAKVHGIPKDQVHLHEIGALDTIIDIIGTIYGLHLLGVFDQNNPTSLFAAPIAVGGGQIKTAHGILPVPAPATLAILERTHLQFQAGPVDFELATPTGVCLLAGMKEMGFLSQNPLPHQFSLLGTGIGLGSLSLPDREDILRIFHGKISENPASSKTQWESSVQRDFGNLYDVHILETNLDDVRGEILGHIIPKLMSQGALDVSILSTITKKNRPGHLLRVICNEKHIPLFIKTILDETSTLGIRISRHQRVCVKRVIIEKMVTIQGKKFTVHYKVAKTPSDEIIQVKAEFEDLRLIAEDLGISIHEVERNLPVFKK